MRYPKVLQVEPTENYTVLITFENGELRRFDVTPYIVGEWFGKLKDKAVFSTVRPCGNTIEWSEGQDIAPHELYELSIPVA